MRKIKITSVPYIVEYIGDEEEWYGYRSSNEHANMYMLQRCEVYLAFKGHTTDSDTDIVYIMNEEYIWNFATDHRAFRSFKITNKASDMLVRTTLKRFNSSDKTNVVGY